MSEFSRTVGRNSAWGLVAQFAIKVVSFVFSVLIVRQLGAEAYGQYSAVVGFVMLFAFFSDIGLNSYAVREVARYRNLRDSLAPIQALFNNVLALRMGLSLVTVAVVVLAGWVTHRPGVMIGAIALHALSLCLYAVQGASEVVVYGFERLDLLSGARILNQVVFVVGAALVLIAGGGYYGLIFAGLLGVGTLTYVTWRGAAQLGMRVTRLTPRDWPGLLRASLPFGVIGLTLGLSYKFDTVLINSFRSDAETGYYSAAYNLVFSAAAFSNAFNTALYPSLTREMSSAPERLPHIFERAMRYLMLVALPVAAGIWALTGDLVPLLYKQAYSATIPALQIIIWTVPFMYASEFLGYVINITGREKIAARSLVLSTALNVGFNLVLIPRYGYLAAAVMTVVTEAILVGQYLFTLRSLIRQVRWLNCLGRPLLATGIMTGVVLVARGYLPILATILIGVLVYGVSVLAVGGLGREEWNLARHTLTRALEGRWGEASGGGAP